jgi:hypothetical protein
MSPPTTSGIHLPGLTASVPSARAADADGFGETALPGPHLLTRSGRRSSARTGAHGLRPRRELQIPWPRGSSIGWPEAVVPVHLRRRCRGVPTGTLAPDRRHCIKGILRFCFIYTPVVDSPTTSLTRFCARLQGIRRRQRLHHITTMRALGARDRPKLPSMRSIPSAWIGASSVMMSSSRRLRPSRLARRLAAWRDWDGTAPPGWGRLKEPHERADRSRGHRTAQCRPPAHPGRRGHSRLATSYPPCTRNPGRGPPVLKIRHHPSSMSKPQPSPGSLKPLTLQQASSIRIQANYLGWLWAKTQSHLK